MFFFKTTYLFAEMIIIDHPSKPGLVLEEKGLAVPQQGQAGAAPRGDLRNHRITDQRATMGPWISSSSA